MCVCVCDTHIKTHMSAWSSRTTQALSPWKQGFSSISKQYLEKYVVVIMWNVKALQCFTLYMVHNIFTSYRSKDCLTKNSAARILIWDSSLVVKLNHVSMIWFCDVIVLNVMAWLILLKKVSQYAPAMLFSWRWPTCESFKPLTTTGIQLWCLTVHVQCTASVTWLQITLWRLQKWVIHHTNS